MKLRHNEMSFYLTRRMFHFTSRLDKRFLQENFLHHLHSHNIKQFYVNFMIAKDKKKKTKTKFERNFFLCLRFLSCEDGPDMSGWRRKVF